MKNGAQRYKDNGVIISKSPVVLGEEVVITYNGFLAQSGANVIYAHVGYGDLWEGKMFIPMVREKDAFKASLKVSDLANLNVCFKDGYDNWDNNAYNNYSFEVTKKAKQTKTTESKKEAETTKRATKTSETKKTTKK